MSLKIEGKTEHKGFILNETFESQEKLIVLTGKNGSGKTRFFESTSNNQFSNVILQDNNLTSQQIKLIEQKSLMPSFHSQYNNAQYEEKIRSTLELYDKIKADFDAPLDENRQRQFSGMHMHEHSGLQYKDLYFLTKKISCKLKKPASQLTHDEIILYFDETPSNVLGMQSISTIVNRYIKRKHDNEYHEFRASKGQLVKYFSDEEFIQEFGERPWEIINEILLDVFEGKFYFNKPDEKLYSYSYQAKLMEKNNPNPIDINSLSSGEKTLFWLALTLFNSQYYDNSNTNSAPRLLLLDEPDAFLHPKMVVKMYQVLESFIYKFNTTIMITTHSPTTIALAAENSTYLIADNKVAFIDKDTAIAELLDGVTQIAINPENRRQVFTESKYDAVIYEKIYRKLLQKSKNIDSKISLIFTSAGPKVPQQLLKDKLKQICKIEDDNMLDDFVTSVNGVGSCSQVYGTVESFSGNNHNIRGIVDWDTKNKPNKNVVVFAKDIAYAIENIVFDPICILTLLHLEYPDKYTMESICGKEVDWKEWIKDSNLLQISIDKYILNVLDKTNQQDVDLKYISGKSLKTDAKYLKYQGHNLEDIILEKYPQLNSKKKNGKDGELKEAIVKYMIGHLSGDFIAEFFEQAMIKLQQ